MTLVPYGSGMAGDGDERGRGAAPVAWHAERMRLLREMVDEAFTAVRAVTPPPDDLKAIDAKTRAIINLARAVVAVTAAGRQPKAPAGRSGGVEPEGDNADRPDAATLEQYKAELLGRIARRKAILAAREAEAVAGDGGGVAEGLPGAAGHGGPPDPGDEAVEDLGDAGWPGIGQDLRWSTLVT